MSYWIVVVGVISFKLCYLIGSVMAYLDTVRCKILSINLIF